MLEATAGGWEKSEGHGNLMLDAKKNWQGNCTCQPPYNLLVVGRFSPLYYGWNIESVVLFLIIYYYALLILHYFCIVDIWHGQKPVALIMEEI